MVFRLIELPLLMRILPGAFALIFVICLTSFAVALTLGGGPRATTIELAIYQAFRFDFNLGRAALLSLVQLFVAGGAAVLAFWLVPAVTFGGGMDRMQKRWDAQGNRARALDGCVHCLCGKFPDSAAVGDFDVGAARAFGSAADRLDICMDLALGCVGVGADFVGRGPAYGGVDRHI